MWAQLGILKIHIESVHEKVKYPCNQCEYKAIGHRSITRHIRSVHEKVKYLVINLWAQLSTHQVTHICTLDLIEYTQPTH